MSRWILQFTILNLLLATPAQTAGDCETVGAYFKKLPEVHFSLTKEAMKNLAYRSAYEAVEGLQPQNQFEKIAFFALLETAGDDYEKICETLSVIYRDFQKENASSESLSEFIENYLRKTLNAIDFHTYYLDNKAVKEEANENRNQFLGLGIQFHAMGKTKGEAKEKAKEKDRKGPFMIHYIMPNSPAIEKGLQVDDLILKVNTTEGSTLTLAEFGELISKQEGKFSFEISRGGQKITIADLDRKLFFASTVTSHFINDEGLAYIQIFHFSLLTGVELAIHLLGLKNAYGSDVKGILLDLRGNPGGALVGALMTTDLFLNSGVIYTQYGKNYEKSDSMSATDGTVTDAPLLILISASSASASELVSSALQDHGRALILGERSFGKGTVLQLLSFGEETAETAVYYTKSVYYRPTGETVQRNGVIPDIEIVDPEWKATMEELKKNGKTIKLRESDYEKTIVADPKPTPFTPTSAFRTVARERLLGRATPIEYSDIEKKDIQLAKAIEYLKLYTEIPITMNHFGFAHYYKTPEHRLHINCDLYKKDEGYLPVRLQFFTKKKKYWLFGPAEEGLIYETFGFISGEELTITLKNTAVQEYVEGEEHGSFIVKIDVQKKTKDSERPQLYTHKTIVIF